MIAKYNEITIELHPGQHCFGMACPHCLGASKERSSITLELNDYKKFIRSIPNTGIHFNFNGFNSDPLSYVDIIPLTEFILTLGHSVSFNTKGLGPLKEIAVLLSQYYSERNEIEISIDASSGSEYRDIHASPAKLFDSVYKNIRDTHYELEEHRRKVKIKASFRLFKQNSGLESINMFVKVFNTIVDSIEFIVPNSEMVNFSQENLLSSEEIKSLLVAINKVYSKSVVVSGHQNSISKLLRTSRSENNKIIVDADGKVYSSFGITSNESVIGNILEQNYGSLVPFIL